MAPAAVLEFAQKSHSPSEVRTIVNEALQDAELFIAVNDVAVCDRATLEQAARVRNEIGAKLKRIKSQIAEPKSWAYNLHRWISSLETAACAKYLALDKVLQDRIRTFREQEDRRRQQRERELAAQLQKDREDRAIAVAVELERTGQSALGQSVLHTVTTAAPAAVRLPDETRVAGQKWVRRWKWRLGGGDAPAMRFTAVVGPGPRLVEAVERLLDRMPDEQLLAALGPALEAEKALVPREFLILDDRKVDGIVESMKESAVKALPACIEVYYVDDPVRG